MVLCRNPSMIDTLWELVYDTLQKHVYGALHEPGYDTLQEHAYIHLYI